VPIIALGAVQEAASKVPRSTRLSGSDYLRELLNCGTKKHLFGLTNEERDVQSVVSMAPVGTLVLKTVERS
jgi:hypothetical protein